MKKALRLSAISLLLTSLFLGSSESFAYPRYKGDYGYKGDTYKPRPRVVRTCPPPCGLRDGFYAGIAGGYDSYKVRDSLTFTIPTVLTASTNPALNPTGFLGGLFLGYGHYFDIFYLGAEIFGNYTSASASYTDSFNALLTGNAAALYNQVTFRGSYGAGLLPGLKVNDKTLFYLKAAYSRANVKVNENVSSSVASANLTTLKWINGFNYGLGLETLLCDRVSLRGEYTHTNYSSFYSKLNAKVSPADNQFMLGLIYHIS